MHDSGMSESEPTGIQFECPGVLYHYTDAAGLKGILHPSWPTTIVPPESGGSALLHASDVRYMNDSAELRFGADLMIGSLRADARTHNDDFAEVFGEVADRLEPDLFGPTTQHNRAFAACFCENGDLLSQWRGYAGGVGGFAIGFPAEVLLTRAVSVIGRPIMAPLDSRVPVMPVIYGESAAVASIDRHLRDLREGRGFVVMRNGKPAVEWLLGDVYRLIARLKDEAFQEEREWRLIALVEPGHPQTVPVRPRAAGLVPYVHFGINLPVREGDGDQFTRLPKTIANIIVGPGTDQNGQAWAVGDLLQTAGYPQTDITLSRVPYRG